MENVKDSSRGEVNKMKKSIKSGMSTNEIYRPMLVWFEQADFFWKNVVTRSLNLARVARSCDHFLRVITGHTSDLLV